MINVQALFYGMLLFISIFLSACGGGSSASDGGDTQSPINIESYLSGKSLRVGQNNYTYLMPDKRFYSYANGGDLGWIYHGAGNNGAWSVDNNLLRVRYEDNDVWVYRIEKDKNQATLIENGESVHIVTVFPIAPTPEGLIKQVELDHAPNGSVTTISASELIAGQWIVLNLTDGHSITVNYSDDKKLYRYVGHTIEDKGFVEQDTWRVSSDGREIIHRDVTHELIKKETGCYFTRSTSASDSNWVKEYKLCAGSSDTGGSGDTTAPVVTLKGEKDISVGKDSVYVDAGASATDDVDGNVAVTVSGKVETNIAAVYTLTYTAQDKAGNSSSTNRIVRVIEQLPFKVSPVEGNTVEYNSVATFTVQPSSEPTSEVIIALSSSDEAQGVVETDKLVFTPENWESPQTVTIRGANQNPVDDKQDYQVVLSPAESVDLQYQGVDIEDIAIRGISLVVSAPDNLRAVLAGVDNEIKLQAQYNGGKTLYYELENPVENMTIEPFSGVITYRPDESLEGSSVDVAVSMTDGRQATREEFQVRVADAMPVDKYFQGDNLIITEGGNRILITTPDQTITSLSISKINAKELPPMPEGIIPLTWFYNVNLLDSKEESGFIEIRLEDINIPANIDFNTIKLYSVNSLSDIKWLGRIHSLGEDNDDIIYPIFNNKGVYFFGAKSNFLEDKPARKSNTLSAEVSDERCSREIIKKKFLSNYLDNNLEFSSVKCKIGSSIISFVDIENEPGFLGEDGVNLKGVGKHTYNDLLKTFGDLAKNIESINYKSVEKIYVIFAENFYAGNEILENVAGSAERSTLKNYGHANIFLKKHYAKENSLIDIIAHEYFHIADISIHEEFYSWIYEGLATWYGDYVFDDNDYYKYLFGNKAPNILEKNSKNKTNGLFSSSYYASLFWGMSIDKCDNINPYAISELSVLVKNKEVGYLISKLDELFLNGRCDFGGIAGLGLKSAIAYYQYATIYEGKISLLGGNEKDDFDFIAIQSVDIIRYIKEDLFGYYSKDIGAIPPVGSKSFVVERIEGKNKAKINFAFFNKNITVSVISEEPFQYLIENGKKENASVIFVGDKSLYQAYFDIKYLDAQRPLFSFEYHAESELPKLFISLINTSDTSSDIQSNVGVTLFKSGIDKGIADSLTISYKHSVSLILDKGKIEATINFNETTIDPDEKLYVNLIRTDAITSDDIDNLVDQFESDDPTNSGLSDAEIVATVEVDTTQPSPFIYTFEGLELTRYSSLTYGVKPDGTETVYDFQQATITEESPDYTEKVTHEVDMGYVTQTGKFTQTEAQGTWDITETSSDKTFVVQFKSDETVVVTGDETDIAFSGGGKWTVNDDDELEIRDYFFEPVTGTTVLLTTHIHKISGNQGGCHIISSRMLYSGWTNEYKMCKR